ncbi:MAG TPA: arginase, partial [Vicinamibacteria bacterium]|nr:arginase [Vicinamibacteria bacterium]
MPAKKIRFIGVPLDLGAGRRGVDMGPSAFRVAEIHSRVRSLGYEVSDRGDIDVFIQETHDPGDPRLKYLKEIRHTCEEVRDEVDRALGQGAMPVVLGGDHSIAMGTIAGVSRHFRKQDERIGLIWFDAHGDMNTPETSPSGNIHGMPLAVALGIGEKSLVSLAGDEGPMVEGARAAVVGLRDVDPAEKENIRESGIGAFTMRDIDER